MRQLLSKVPYRPEVDGLRAVAVLAVIIFHADGRLLPGGFVGVDVFFVISGYLITSIILADIQTGSFCLKHFWERRIRRILPALAVMIIGVALLAMLIGLPWLMSEVGKEGLAATVGLGNYRMLTLTSDYWSVQSERIPLLHTWSLGVEEQFYLLFPPLLFIATCLRRNALVIALVATCLASMIWCAIQTQEEQAHAFFMMAPRGWELMFGALLAVLPAVNGSCRRVWHAPVAMLGLLLIILGSLFISPNLGFPWPFALVPCIATAAIIICSDGNDLVGRLLGSRWLVRIGKASYSLYLWHWPALAFGLFLGTALEIPSLRLAGLFVGLAMGTLSYLFIEPVGRLEAYVKLGAPIMVAASLGLCSWLAFHSPAVIQEHYQASPWQGARYDSRSGGSIKIAGLGDATKPKLDLLLVGDSHALSLAPALDEMLLQKSVRGAVYASGGARITSWSPSRYDMSPQQRLQFESARDAEISASQPRLIILCARWETFDSKEGLASVDKLLEKFRALSPHSRLVVVSQAPHLDFGDIKASEWLNWRVRLGVRGACIKVLQNRSFADAHAHLAELCRLDVQTRFIDLAGAFPVVNGYCDIAPDNSVVLYDDDDHLSLAGARRVVALMVSDLDDI